MSDYNKATNFTTKDTLPSGNANKIVKGTELDTEFNAISSAIASKANTASPAFTGTPTAPVPTAGSNTSQIATTSFVTGALSSGTIGANTTGNAATATNASNLATTNFTITESGGKLVFKYGATVIASMDSAGNITTANNVTAYGTP